MFEGKEFDSEKVWHKIMLFVWSWLKAFQGEFSITYQLWQVDPSASLENFRFVG